MMSCHCVHVDRFGLYWNQLGFNCIFFSMFYFFVQSRKSTVRTSVTWSSLVLKTLQRWSRPKSATSWLLMWVLRHNTVSSRWRNMNEPGVFVPLILYIYYLHGIRKSQCKPLYSVFIYLFSIFFSFFSEIQNFSVSSGHLKNKKNWQFFRLSTWSTDASDNHWCARVLCSFIFEHIN